MIYIMSDRLYINKFVVDGEYAERIYEIFRKSYFVENSWQPFDHCSVQVEFDLTDGVFRVEEKTDGEISFIADILYFFADRSNIFSMTEHIVNGVVQSYSVDDSEGKYFVRPPKTEWELQQEEVQRLRREQGDDDLPF